jgi:hypothetical protein
VIIRGAFDLSDGTRAEFRALETTESTLLSKIHDGLRCIYISGERLDPIAHGLILVLRALVSPSPAELMEMLKAGQIKEGEVIDLYNAIVDFTSDQAMERPPKGSA